MGRKEDFIRVFKKAEKHYGKSEKRLAAEGWGSPWKVLIATILSAQSRDETTIPIATRLFGKYGSLPKLSKAKLGDVRKTLKGMNYYKTKARNVKGAARMIIDEFNGEVPDNMDDLVRLPGVGRKTANLVITEVFGKEGICVDTHVHRISNVFGFVDTRSRDETEMELRELVPRKYWSRINRIFVLWGKEVPGRDKIRLMKKLKED